MTTRNLGQLKAAFPDFDVLTLPEIPDIWTDTSWQNDCCPSFEVTPDIRVMVDYAECKDREFPDTNRFCVTLADGTSEATDDWQRLLALVAMYERDALHTMSADELNSWYERNVGYRPQVDDPAMTDAALRELCIGVHDESEYARLNPDAE